MTSSRTLTGTSHCSKKAVGFTLICLATCIIHPIVAFCPDVRITPKRTTAVEAAPRASLASTRDQLLQAVLEKPQNAIQVETLVKDLISTSDRGSNTYDPSESLFGPLYCTLAAFTPGDNTAKKPLWERISLKKDNIKGQQYSFGGDTEDPTKGSVINYSEIWGPQVHLRAIGTFVAAESGNLDTAKENSLWSALNSFGTSPKKRSCPDDFTVTVSGASIHVLGKTLNIPIEGSSTLRVLYADRDLRVFVSPQRSESLVGDWEQAGLIVVQVHSAIVTGSPIDLRGA